MLVLLVGQTTAGADAGSKEFDDVLQMFLCGAIRDCLSMLCCHANFQRCQGVTSMRRACNLEKLCTRDAVTVTLSATVNCLLDPVVHQIDKFRLWQQHCKKMDTASALTRTAWKLTKSSVLPS